MKPLGGVIETRWWIMACEAGITGRRITIGVKQRGPIACSDVIPEHTNWIRLENVSRLSAGNDPEKRGKKKSFHRIQGECQSSALFTTPSDSNAYIIYVYRICAVYDHINTLVMRPKLDWFVWHLSDKQITSAGWSNWPGETSSSKVQNVTAKRSQVTCCRRAGTPREW